MTAIVICSLNFAVVLTLTALTFCFYKYLKKVSNVRIPAGDLPFVSVVVPARNEEKKIGRLLQSLVNQDYPSFEIIAVDDRSTDGTAGIIASFASKHARLKYVKSTTLPEGWVGKCNALAHAHGSTSGEWLLFTDADTWHSRNSIRDAVSWAIANKADLVSFVPVQELGSFWERVIMPVLLGSFLCGDPFHTINDRNNPRAYAYGQYILVRRSAYQAAGGHQAIHDAIVEDHALAYAVKRSGFHVLCADGRGLYKVRMYTDLDTLWQGWTKNLYSLIDCRPLNLFIVLSLINCTALLPFVQAAMVAFLYLSGQAARELSALTLLAVLQLLTLAACYSKSCYHYQGVDWRHFLLLPLGSLSATALYLHSAYLVHTGGQVKWKGRHYRVNPSKTITTAKAHRRSPQITLAKKSD